MSDNPKLATPVLAVTMDDGATYEIQVVNKDMLAFDRIRARRGWPTADAAPFVWLTFLAWSALTRENAIPTMTLDEFENAALEVRPITNDDGEESGADPIQAVAGDI